MKLALLLLKNLPEELAHSLALGGLKFLYKLKILNLFIKKPKNNEFQLLGMNFTNLSAKIVEIDRERSVDIDEMKDLEIAKIFLKYFLTKEKTKKNGSIFKFFIMPLL